MAGKEIVWVAAEANWAAIPIPIINLTDAVENCTEKHLNCCTFTFYQEAFGTVSHTLDNINPSMVFKRTAGWLPGGVLRGLA
jgi:hypothetical protein